MIDEADHLGLMIFAEVPEIKNYAVRDTWEENKEDWSARMADAITQNFNHPSIVMWWSGFNVFAHGEDQNPARIGQLDEMRIQNDEWERRVKIGWEAMDRMRAEDPTRGVYSHNGSIVGDIQTTNVYLCLIPLQEREEWLSDWADKGDMPFLACEFGLPLDNTFMQGRAGGGWTSLGQGKNAKGAANSAMMLTEYAAIYLGPEAYALQTDDYADGIVQSHFKGFIHDRNLGLNGWSSPTVDPLIRLIRSDAYQRIQVLFNTNTFRSWRAWGMTGGVNPWSFTGHTHKETS
jgi:beta-galactosidase